jgi:phage gp29-like protein
MGTITVPAEILQRSNYDAYPGHWGAAMTVAIVGAKVQQAEYGWRTGYVDLLSELVKADGHASGVLRKLFTAVSNKPWNMRAAETTDEREAEQAQIIAEEARKMVAAIPRWKKHVAGLLWGWFYGASGRELKWALTPAGYRVSSVGLIHSRRICYDTSTTNWRAYITDGGASSNEVYADAWPGRILLFEPSLDDDYQPRQGLGQVLCWWMAFKRFTARDMLAYVERFGKPCPIVTYKTDRQQADADSDIPLFKELVQKIGRGTQPGAAIPDTGTLTLVGNGGSNAGGGGSGENTPHKALIDLCNAEESKAIVTATLTAEVGKTGGAYGLGKRQGNDQDEVIDALAAQFDDCVTESLIAPWVQASFGAKWAHLSPAYHTEVEQDDDLKTLGEVLDLAVNKLKMRVPARWAHEAMTIPEPVDDEPVLGGGDDAEEPDAETEDETTPAPEADKQGSNDEPAPETGTDETDEQGA